MCDSAHDALEINRGCEFWVETQCLICKMGWLLIAQGFRDPRNIARESILSDGSHFHEYQNKHVLKSTTLYLLSHQRFSHAHHVFRGYMNGGG